MSVQSRLRLSRPQLAAFLPDPDAIRAFERALDACDRVEDASAGSNASGAYAKLLDGWMLCVGAESGLLTISTVSGALYAGSASFTFPVPFVVTPCVLLQCRRASGLLLPGDVSALTVNGFTGSMLTTVSGSTGYLSYLAIGRWR